VSDASGANTGTRLPLQPSLCGGLLRYALDQVCDRHTEGIGQAEKVGRVGLAARPPITPGSRRLVVMWTSLFATLTARAPFDVVPASPVTRGESKGPAPVAGPWGDAASRRHPSRPPPSRACQAGTRPRSGSI